ncbi:hypothetical protein [Streptomyces sp. F001]|nr:hypothetical protein [Streptomyces sp. F001]
MTDHPADPPLSSITVVSVEQAEALAERFPYLIPCPITGWR